MDRPNSEQINFFIQTMVRNNFKATEIHKLLSNAWVRKTLLRSDEYNSCRKSIRKTSERTVAGRQGLAVKEHQEPKKCRRIPHKLTDVHKQQRVDGARIILRDVDPSVMVIDEKWLYSHPFPSTNNVRAWINKIGGQGDRPTIARRNISEVKFHIIVAINFRGLCHFVILRNCECTALH